MPTTKSPLTIFCEERKIDNRTKDAFGMWIRSTYADKFRVARDGETAHLILNRLSQEDLLDAWQDFVKHLKQYLT